VLELLVMFKAVKKTDVRDNIVDVAGLTEEEAELIGAETFTENEKDNNTVLYEQAHEGEEIDSSVFAKVRCHMSQTRCILMLLASCRALSSTCVPLCSAGRVLLKAVHESRSP
jgi:hypothetical protein